MSKVDLEKVPSALQKHFALHGVEMVHRETYKGHSIFVGDGVKTPKEAKEEFNGARIVDSSIPGPGERSKEDLWMRNGYYITAFGIQRGSAVIGFPLYFEYDHDMNRSKHSRKKARINSALFAAKEAMDSMIAAGLIEHKEGSIIIPHHA